MRRCSQSPFGAASRSPIPPDVLSTNTVRPESLSMSACSCAVEPLCGSGITDPTGPLTSCVSFVSSTAASFAVDDGMGDWPCQGRLEIPPMRGCRTRSAVRARVYVPSGVAKSAR